MITIHGPDPIRGHIAVISKGMVCVTACDLGPVLTLWAYHSVDLTPDDARALAAALNAWAERDHPPARRDDDDALCEAVGLLDEA